MGHTPALGETTEVGSAAVPLVVQRVSGVENRWQTAMLALNEYLLAALDSTLLTCSAARAAARALMAGMYAATETSADGDRLVMRLGRIDGGPAGSIVEQALSSDPARSLAAFALNAGQVVVVDDLSQQQRPADPVLAQLGVASAVECPLVHERHVFGTLGVYSVQPHGFDADARLLIETIAATVAARIVEQRNHQQLLEQLDFTSQLLDTLDAPVLKLADNGRIIGCNAVCGHVTEYTEEELLNRSIWSALLLPEEMEAVRDALESVRRGEPAARFESFILTKNGERRRLSWSVSGMRDDTGDVATLICTAVDVTRQFQLQQELERAENDALTARKSLERLQTEPTDERRDERRQLPRRDYPYLQRIAPYRGGRLPARDDFMQVQCRDITSRGFAFFADTAPDYDRLVAAFGGRASAVHVVAEVVHVTSIEHEGRQCHLVGCSYQSRALYSRRES